MAKKIKRRKMVNKVALSIGAVVVVIIGLLTWAFVDALAKHLKNEDIVNNGTQTTATVTDFYTRSSVNDVPYYYVEYEFTDEEGNKHIGQTSSDYTVQQVEELIKNGLLICYDSEYNSIQADYKFKLEGSSFFIVFSPIFIIMALMIGIIIFLGNRSSRSDNSPVEATAKFVSATYALTSEGEEYYTVRIKFKNKFGEKIEDDIYFAHELSGKCYFTRAGVEELKRLSGIGVSVLGNKAIIDDDGGELSMAYFEDVPPVPFAPQIEAEQARKAGVRKPQTKTQNLGTLASSNVLRCLRCGDIVPPGKTKCPTCGSKNFDNIVE